ncbi:MAG: ATP-grasp domain-containing protein [Bryobacteraceae bacterium]
MSKRILIAASTTGYQTRAFGEAARRMGLTPVLATDRCDHLDNPWGDDAIPVRFEQPEASARSLAADEGVRVDAVVAVGDRPAQLAAHYAELVQLRFHPPGAVAAARNKYLARERFRLAGLASRQYERYGLDADLSAVADTLAYPVVCKPLGLSGSRGVIRADDRRAFLAAAARIRAILDEPAVRQHHDPADRFLQVEAFLPGREFALEGIVSGGRLHTLAIFDKPDPLDGPYFEETLYIAPARIAAAERARIVETTARASRALGFTDGPIHAEMRVNDEGVWMLEAAPRPIGGLCANALRFTRPGADGATPLEEVILRTALGEDPWEWTLAGAATGVMMIPIPREGIYAGVRGVDKAAAIAGVTEVAITAKLGQRMRPLPEGASYLGFLFARAGSPGAVEQALREAHDCLDFDLNAVLPTLPVER